MSKSVKIWLVIATVLVAIGLFVFVSVMATYGWDFSKLSTVNYKTNIYELKGEFDKISINVDTTDIEFALAEDDCSVVCFEEEKVSHSVTVQNDTLFIGTVDTRKWYEHISISIGEPKMTVYLPKNEYVSLFIETDTSDITVPKEFSFETLRIDGDTSDVDCFATVSQVMEIEVSTGDINVDTDTAGGLNLVSSTGDIRVSNIKVKENIDIETDTGDVRFENSDAAEISVETSTGDVIGTLLSEKVFITETSTGDISVPKTTSGGKCEVKTSTGDIKINVVS